MPLTSSDSIPPEWATQDRGTQITVVFWVEVGVALCFISTRLFSRYMIRQIGLDDAMMTVSMVSSFISINASEAEFGSKIAFIALSGIITSIAQQGGFRHLPFVPQQNATDIVLKSLIAQAVTIFAYGTSKFAVGFLILRLLPPSARWQKYFIWSLISLTLSYNWLQIVLTFVQCRPYEGAWNVTVPSVCWTKEKKLANIYMGGVWNILVDVILALFPALIIWRLQLSIRKKATLVVLLGLGILAAVCACIKLSFVSSLFSNDLTWSTYDLDVWSGTELFLVIVCGSIPPSKPLWDHIFPNRRWSTNKSYSYAAEKSVGSHTRNHTGRSDYDTTQGISQPDSWTQSASVLETRDRT